MYICSCNGLTDNDVHAAVDAGATRPVEVYAARKCRAQCGNCVKGVVCLLREALKKRNVAPAVIASIELGHHEGSQAVA
ncbi:(2Fe-2S)-binding protein [Acetobacter conturbans]|uniref:Bacterioferritin-associated ferredoxin n=1 Tax=Acetobacter conturbans TaxID=1737472 RepID=A0ABX0K4N4_9PROT|nr:(2Fe-2S)-binding protein [Acetobacter conturbans]NHN89165.1 bacterioferritin [Acetobacter conturbans]